MTSTDRVSTIEVVLPHVGEAVVAAPVLALVLAAAAGVVLQVRERRGSRRR